MNKKLNKKFNNLWYFLNTFHLLFQEKEIFDKLLFYYGIDNRKKIKSSFKEYRKNNDLINKRIYLVYNNLEMRKIFLSLDELIEIKKARTLIHEYISLCEEATKLNCDILSNVSSTKNIIENSRGKDNLIRNIKWLKTEIKYIKFLIENEKKINYYNNKLNNENSDTNIKSKYNHLKLVK